MAEAEDVLTDAARHATIFARALWRRHRPPSHAPASIKLADVAQRLELLIIAVFGLSGRLRVAQAPAPPTALRTLLRRCERPWSRQALPATDGEAIWLPRELPAATGLERYRSMALQQAMRMARGSVQHIDASAPALLRDIYLLLEAAAADAALIRLLPGMAESLNALRREALVQRPALDRFAAERRRLELFARDILQTDCRNAPPHLTPASPAQSWQQARALAQALDQAGLKALRHPLFKDYWSGELRPPPPMPGMATDTNAASEHMAGETRSARLARRPQIRSAGDDEEEQRQGAWMVQSAQPQEHAEDPIGMQRPTDRDASTAADEFADALSELPEARLVSTPEQAKEVLLSDDPPPARSRKNASATMPQTSRIAYPEWDYRLDAYRDPGAQVLLLPPQRGSAQWVADTLAAHRALLESIRRRFDMLRADRVRLRKQLDGEEIDLDAYIDSRADFAAGRPPAQALYRTARALRRDMAILLLVDVSGSTDAWLSAQRRVIDVEREALLLVCIALEGLHEPYAVQAFSGTGPDRVTLRDIKHFRERYGDEVARRIAALEPEHYTRAGAAIRHASANLMREPARHRLLLLLSDGKPNDIDDYEGRYGVEDMRQAVTEARLQGIFPFCLTIDRQAAGYLPQVFGAHQYALLPKPELLPAVLLDWLKRLVRL
jgi:nitric oxide reductase NorD protein